MSFYEERLQGSSHTPAGDARRRVVEAVRDAKLSTHSVDPELDLYLALLQDRLPVYVGTLTDLLKDIEHPSVPQTLVRVCHATIDFYSGVLAAKVSVFARPVQLARLRQVMRARQIGPHNAEDAVAAYLREEQKLGRVAAEVEPLAAARLLIGGCLNYAFLTMLMGEDHAPPAEEYAAGIVRGLRLDP